MNGGALGKNHFLIRQTSHFLIANFSPRNPFPKYFWERNRGRKLFIFLGDLDFLRLISRRRLPRRREDEFSQLFIPFDFFFADFAFNYAINWKIWQKTHGGIGLLKGQMPGQKREIARPRYFGMFPDRFRSPLNTCADKKGWMRKKYQAEKASEMEWNSTKRWNALVKYTSSCEEANPFDLVSGKCHEDGRRAFW